MAEPTNVQLAYSRSKIEVQCTDADCRGILWRRSVRSEGSSDMVTAVRIAKRHASDKGHNTLIRNNEEIIVRRTDG